MSSSDKNDPDCLLPQGEDDSRSNGIVVSLPLGQVLRALLRTRLRISLTSNSQNQMKIGRRRKGALPRKLRKEKIGRKPNDEPLEEWVGIGTGQTLVHRDRYKKINWTCDTLAIQSLLVAIFSKRTLATRCLSENKSPAFPHKPSKASLDPRVIDDVIYEIKKRFGTPEPWIRNIIKAKCAEEGKKLRIRQRMKSARNKENIQPSADA